VKGSHYMRGVAHAIACHPKTYGVAIHLSNSTDASRFQSLFAEEPSRQERLDSKPALVLHSLTHMIAA